ncbi:glutamate receptor ionotropic, NMDA 2B-like [Zootermopsis nevadensis]|uniref:glutamate receptor ionotropic, NMDA 2B-like n=1 Tax=Zootermopsis nevadensis TaxID=136037 RepID=UPI000B8E692F|nr:glutamate receptor ionotropic, NMDA 2B-like [Zootermopsis nevadensis]
MYGYVFEDLEGSGCGVQYLKKVSQKQLFHAYVSWLIITEKKIPAVDSSYSIEERLRYFNIGIDTDLVIATKINVSDISDSDGRSWTHGWGDKADATNDDRDGTYRVRKTDNPVNDEKLNSVRSYCINENEKYHERIRIQKEEKRRRNNRKYNNKNNRNDKTSEIGNCVENSNRREYYGLEFSLLQVYKIRPNSNNSLIMISLGSWNAINGTLNMVSSNGIEQRNDFRGFPLFVGVKNTTQNTGEVVGGSIKSISLPAQNSDDEIEYDTHLMEVLDLITRSLNASYELIPFSKLGWKNDQGAWLFMLGAVTVGTVDLGLDNVVITPDRYRDMFFTLPIVQSMRNIYFRRPETGAMRDIFLAPFSPRLLASVVATGVVIATAMFLVNASTAKTNRRNESNSNSKSSKTKWILGEAMVWSVSVLCMQGSSWSPKSPSGCLVLIFSLCFALVIYNAYAAFITSVLSVRVGSIRGLGDLLESDFHFGYTRKGQDEAFLLGLVNDSALRQLYLRGFVKNHGVDEASSGLLKASHGGYAFFVSARLGRKALNSFIAQDKRCAIQELTVEATKSAIALPMGIASPYRRLINLSLLRMREAGVLGPIQEHMLPPMPRCQAYSAFNSASLTDVYSAFLVLGGGLAAAICMGLSEKVWKHRVSIGHWLAIKWAGRDKVESISDQQRLQVHRQMHQRSRFQHDIQWFN